MNNLITKVENLPSVFKDPFGEEFVWRISIEIRAQPFFDDKNVKACIYFCNGSTNGSQNFQSDTLEEIMYKIDSFLKEIKK